MAKKKILNLDRFKKSTQGLIELACLIEQADPTSAPLIIQQIKQNDYDLCMRVMRKIVFFHELIFLDEGILAEILAGSTPKVTAYALYYENDETKEKFQRLMGLRERRLIRDEEEKMSAPPSKSFVAGAQKTILRTARQLEKKNKFIFELTDCPRFEHGTQKTGSDG